MNFFSFSKNNCIYYLDKTKTGQRLQRYSAYSSGLQVKSTYTATCRTNYHCLLTISNSPTLLPVELITITNSPTSWPWSCLQKRFYSFPLPSTFISCLCLLYLQFHCSTANLFFLIDIIIFKASFQSAAWRAREEIKKKILRARENIKIKGQLPSPTKLSRTEERKTCQLESPISCKRNNTQIEK